jgi:hypothetical protein
LSLNSGAVPITPPLLFQRTISRIFELILSSILPENWYNSLNRFGLDPEAPMIDGLVTQQEFFAA